MQGALDLFFENVFFENGFAYDPIAVHRDLQNIPSVFLSNGGGFWMLFENEKIVGSAGLKIIDDQKKEGELKCMYVLSQYKGRGFGGMLIEKVKDEALHRKISVIKLDVKRSAQSAICFYVKNGFYQIPRYNENQNDVIFMEYVFY